MSMIAIICLGNLVTHTGCSKSDSGGSGSGSPASAIAGTGDPDAVNAARIELEKHWMQTPDGWISEYRMPGSSFSTFQECKELTFRIEARPISDADKTNGIEFTGHCSFPALTRRQSGPDSEKKILWSDWANDPIEAFDMQKTNGQWQLSDAGMTYGIMTSGTKPSESTLSKLK
jgi:hypothetical protein